MYKTFLMIGLTFALAVVFAAGSLFADEPPLPPQTHTEYSNNKKYYIVSDYENQTTVCYEASDNNPVKKWSIDGWYRYCYITDDGQFCAVFYNGMNLLPRDYTKKDILFTVYKNGEKYDQKTIGEVIRNGKKLQKTVSHYYWGDVADVYNRGIILDTVEGIKLYDFCSKSIPQKNKEGFISAWQEEEIAGYRFELISDTHMESFSFEKDDNGEHTVRCVYGRHSGWLTAPVAFWHIAADGYIYISQKSGTSKNAQKIGKIYINHKKELLYALQGNKIVQYTYRRL